MDWVAGSYALAAVAGVSIVSLIGAAAGARWLERHAVVLAAVALAAGALLGDALLHLLPESSLLWGGFTLPMAALVVAGFLVFFLLETVLRYGHAHGESALAEAHGHHHAHDARSPPAGERRADGHGRVKAFGWMNLVGDGLHNLIDGVVIAAAFLIDVPLGFATALAVALHEIPQELGDFAVLVRAGFSRRRALLFNFLSALVALAGALIFLLLPFDTELLEKYALPITAGGFIYIAAADLIPELHHHTGDRSAIYILMAFLAGLGIMAALLAFG